MTTATAAAIEKETAYTDVDVCNLPDDGKRYELVDGKLVELPPMRMSHAIVVSTINRLFGQYINGERLPFVVGVGAAFRLGMSRFNFRIPDLHVTATRRLSAAIEDEPGVFEGYPDIAIEVVSPSDTYVEVMGKARLYSSRGVATTLLVDLYNREVVVRQGTGEIQVLTEDDMLTGAPVLPGFSCQVAEIFADLDRMTTSETEGN